MSSDIDQFDDPGLKRAVKSIYGGERAPEQLRQKIMGLVAKEAMPTPSHEPHLHIAEPAQATALTPHAQAAHARQTVLWHATPLRLAAAFLIMAGTGTLFMLFVKYGTERPVTISRENLLALIHTHDGCCENSRDHFMPGIPRSDIRAIGRVMGQKLHGTVLAADLVRDGWEYRGGGICPVKHISSAHLMFGRGGQRLSVFSLPASALGIQDEGEIKPQCIDGHMVAGFVRSGGVFCMVGYCKGNRLSLEEVASLVDKHRNDLISETGGIAMQAHPLHGELLR